MNVVQVHSQGLAIISTKRTNEALVCLEALMQVELFQTDNFQTTIPADKSSIHFTIVYDTHLCESDTSSLHDALEQIGNFEFEFNLLGKEPQFLTNYNPIRRC